MVQELRHWRPSHLVDHRDTPLTSGDSGSDGDPAALSSFRIRLFSRTSQYDQQALNSRNKRIQAVSERAYARGCLATMPQPMNFITPKGAENITQAMAHCMVPRRIRTRCRW